MILLRTLDQIESTDLPLVGGKAYRLALLKQHNLNVPSGLVLTSKFLERQLAHHKLTPLWAGSPDVAVTTEALNWVANTLKTKPLAEPLKQALTQQLDSQFPHVESFAVRSSAIDEDQGDYTFAGIHLTELAVPRLLLPVSISRCWASALHETATRYRLTHGMSIQGIRVAVLLQPMLKPYSSGVAFTLNPLTGSQSELVVEASWGLGESVARQQTQPYFYRLANEPPDYPLLESRLGSMPPPPNETEPLTPADLSSLAEQLVYIQGLLGGPQDVEWAKQHAPQPTQAHADKTSPAETRFHFLQTRPISSHKPTPPDQEWLRIQVPDFLPEVVPPLFSSMMARTQATQLLADVGLELPPRTPLLKVIFGRPHLNLSIMKQAARQLGIGLQYQADGSSEMLALDGPKLWHKRGVYRQIWHQWRQLKPTLQRFNNMVEQASNNLAQTPLIDANRDLLPPLRLHDQMYNTFFKLRLMIACGIFLVKAIKERLLLPLPISLSKLQALHLKTDETAAHALDCCQRWDLRLGQHWVERTWLNHATDIFWLTMSEIERTILLGAEMGHVIATTIETRRENYRAYGTLETPRIIWESQIPELHPATEAAGNSLWGLPISPGQQQGTVVVLYQPTAFVPFTDNIILVTARLDSSWLPLLEHVSGLIVETGGLLSHGSIIAREYGLPAVANIPHATQQLQTGDQLLLDGSTGIIQILAKGNPNDS